MHYIMTDPTLEAMKSDLASRQQAELALLLKQARGVGVRTWLELASVLLIGIPLVYMATRTSPGDSVMSWVLLLICSSAFTAVQTNRRLAALTALVERLLSRDS
jgi:hypothetical protein